MSLENSINLNHLRVLREVVQAGSFTKASQRLNLPKSRVSRTIAALERDLGVQLVYRTTRSFQLTDAGLALYRRIADPIEHLSDAISDVSAFADEVSGRLRISAPEDMGVAFLSGVIGEFLADYPKVSIELSLENRMVDLVQEGVDVALRVGRLKDSSLTRHHVGVGRGNIVASPSVVERAGVIHAPEQLESLPFVAFTPNMKNTGEVRLNNGRTEKVLKPVARAASDNLFVTRRLALDGTGWAILPAFMASEEIRKGNLLALLPEWNSMEFPLQFVTPKQREPAPRLERFLAFAIERITPLFT